MVLTDSRGNGWDRNEIAFEQNGNIVQIVGTDFNSGSTFTGVQVTLNFNQWTNIIVYSASRKDSN